MSGHHMPCTVYDRAEDNRIPLYCWALALVKYTSTGNTPAPVLVKSLWHWCIDIPRVGQKCGGWNQCYTFKH